jgi:hypothetical protein
MLTRLSSPRCVDVKSGRRRQQRLGEPLNGTIFNCNKTYATARPVCCSPSNQRGLIYTLEAGALVCAFSLTRARCFSALLATKQAETPFMNLKRQKKRVRVDEWQNLATTHGERSPLTTIPGLEIRILRNLAPSTPRAPRSCLRRCDTIRLF